MNKRLPPSIHVSSVQLTIQRHIGVFGFFPVVVKPVVSVVDHISTDRVIRSLPADQDDGLMSWGLDVCDLREACWVRSQQRGHASEWSFIGPCASSRRSAGNTHALQQRERKQSRRQTGSDPGIFWGLFYVRLVSRHKPNLHTKSRPCCYDHRGDAAWRWKSKCRDTPRGSPVKRSKCRNTCGIQMLFRKKVPSNNEVPTFHMVRTFLTPFSPESISFLHRRGLKSPSDDK